MDDDLGDAIGYRVLRPGTPVRSADGVQIGTVHRVLDNAREHIFDGIEIDTAHGRRFVDAPEVERIYERAVLLTITAEQTRALPERGSGAADRTSYGSTMRRARRAGRSLRDRWHRR